jgi:hypothetical protein
MLDRRVCLQNLAALLGCLGMNRSAAAQAPGRTERNQPGGTFRWTVGNPLVAPAQGRNQPASPDSSSTHGQFHGTAVRL